MDFIKLADESLVELTLLGNNDAYSELVRRHEKAVLAAANRVVGNRYTAEDAAQDAFVTAWTKLNTLKDRANYRAWVCRIARNRALRLAERYRDYIQFDEIENTVEDTSTFWDDRVESIFLHESIDRLSENIKRVINLFYFGNLSLAEIAERESITVAAVKMRLHDGRMQLRKEMGYMSKENEKLLDSVMRRVEEIKKWSYKTNKSGFKKDYDELLPDIENLPESEKKYHALADLLVRGYWWIEGKDNEEMIKQIEDAAYKGNNEEVITFCIRRAEDKLYGKDYIDFVINTQIPKFEELGYTDAVAEEWFNIANAYDDNEFDKKKLAFERALELSRQDTALNASEKAILKCFDTAGETVKTPRRCVLQGNGFELRRIDGKLIRTSDRYSRFGYMLAGYDSAYNSMITFISDIDGIIPTDGMKPGERIDGTREGDYIECIADNVTVTAGGKEFIGCNHFLIHIDGTDFDVYLKSGIGIVVFEHTRLYPAEMYGERQRRELIECTVNGGEGILPLAEGNRWVYRRTPTPFANMVADTIISVENCIGDKAILSEYVTDHVPSYNTDCWSDMILAARSNYWRPNDDGGQELIDMAEYLDRAKELASTEFQKVFTEQFTDCMIRITHSNEGIDPDSDYDNLWNFFKRNFVVRNDDVITTTDYRNYSFEWKTAGSKHSYYCLLNHIYSIFEERCNVLYDKSWADNQRKEFDITRESWINNCKTQLAIHNAHKVKVPAGEFDNSLLVSTRYIYDKPADGWDYRQYDADYYFSEGIGLIKVIYHCGGFLGDAVFELTDYNGKGEGMFPIESGMQRTYECTNIPEGYTSKAVYTYILDDDGRMNILANKTGIKKRGIE